MFKGTKLWIQINGIRMEPEAWELTRLFFDADSIHFIHPDETYPDFTPGALLTVDVEEGKTWSCRVKFYSRIDSPEMIKNIGSSDIEPDYSCEKQVTDDDIKKPGGGILKRRKILAGHCIYKVLSDATGIKLPYGSLTGVRPVKLAMMCLKDGMDKDAAVRHMMGNTGISRNKAGLLYDIARVEQPYLRRDPSMIHLYIGIPFCASRCLYCSFTSYPADRFKSLIAPYMKALEKELLFTADWIKQNRISVGSVYIGGGTPTALDPSSLNSLLQLVNSNFNIDGVEFTVEAGRPDTITLEKLEAMRAGNVSRISINPQTMNEETLRLIGRSHTASDIEDKFKMARKLGFDNINMDIIAGLPNENEAMFRYTLDRIEELGPDSLTVHTMAVKRASRLKEEESDYEKAADAIVEAMIEEAGKSAALMGMRPYYLYRQKNILANLENTGYAKPGMECLYNINTMEEYQSVIALGAGSISKFISPDGKNIERVCNFKEVTLYIPRIDEMIQRKEQAFMKGWIGCRSAE